LKEAEVRSAHQVGAELAGLRGTSFCTSRRVFPSTVLESQKRRAPVILLSTLTKLAISLVSAERATSFHGLRGRVAARSPNIYPLNDLKGAFKEVC
jgi:hypothetical protein